MKKNLLIFLHEGALNRNAYEYCGIKFLKKKFKLKIFNISKLFIKDFDKILKKYKNSICFETGYNLRSFLLRLKIKKYNSLLASVYALSSYPADAYNNLGQGDKIVKHWNFKGVHTGVFFGIPATGNKLNLSGTTLVEMKDGKIAKEQDFFDMQSMISQLNKSEGDIIIDEYMGM